MLQRSAFRDITSRVDHRINLLNQEPYADHMCYVVPVLSFILKWPRFACPQTSQAAGISRLRSERTMKTSITLFREHKQLLID
jgi:hypothetical protein